MDEVFTRVADIQDVFDVFAVEIRYHSACLELYLRFERSLSAASPLGRVSKKRATFKIEIERIKVILDQGSGLTLSEIGDIINRKQREVEVSNKEVKLFLMKQLQQSIKFCPSKTRMNPMHFFP